MSEEERFYTYRIQKSIRYKYGLWGCWDCKSNLCIAHGSKGKMGQLARLLEDKEIFFEKMRKE